MKRGSRLAFTVVAVDLTGIIPDFLGKFFGCHHAVYLSVVPTHVCQRLVAEWAGVVVLHIHIETCRVSQKSQQLEIAKSITVSIIQRPAKETRTSLKANARARELDELKRI